MHLARLLKSMLSVGLLTIFVRACVMERSEVDYKIRTVCPPLKRVANELDLLPVNAEIPGVLQDYGRMRDICRKMSAAMKE